MNLHRSEKKPEWELLPKGQKPNKAQEVAAATKGIVTPGNAVSLAGAAIFADGLKDARNGKHTRGLLKITVGRLADLADGVAADKTGTKSPIGEAVDVSIDKIEIAAALPVLVKEGIIPGATAGLLAAPHIANTALTAAAKKRGNEIHPTKEGKLATGFQWGALASYAIATIAREHDNDKVEKGFRFLGHAITAYAVGLGAVAIKDYAKDAFAPPVDVPTGPETPTPALAVPANTANPRRTTR